MPLGAHSESLERFGTALHINHPPFALRPVHRTFDARTYARRTFHVRNLDRKSLKSLVGAQGLEPWTR
jgi:hypothetical protein